MANYCAITRSNYFRVTNPDRLKKIIEMTYMDEDNIELWSHESEKGTVYAFGGYGNICGLKPSFENDVDDDDDPDYELFAEELSKIVASDDAIIITEVGNEKLRYLTAYGTIITANKIEYLTLNESCVDAARNVLKNQNWTTRMEY